MSFPDGFIPSAFLEKYLSIPLLYHEGPFPAQRSNLFDISALLDPKQDT